MNSMNAERIALRDRQHGEAEFARRGIEHLRWVEDPGAAEKLRDDIIEAVRRIPPLVEKYDRVRGSGEG